MLDWYQHLPERINPIVFTVGFFSLYWYSLMYLLSIGVSGFLLRRYTRNWLSFDQYIDLMFNLVLGMLIGSRVGYVLLYNFSFYLAKPLAIIWPFDLRTGMWIGISGMSYFGGLAGVVIGVGVFVFARERSDRGNPRIKERDCHGLKPSQRQENFWRIADVIALSVPLGYFFGRLGNFLNGELYGRVTEKMWGMYFPDAPLGNVVLRHPSQLYEAFFEGIVLWCVVLFIRKRYYFSGSLASAYIISYGFFRLSIEFFREPDPQIGFLFGWITLGQVIAVMVCVIGIILFFWLRKKKYAILKI